MALEKGITPNGEGFHGKTWNILGQVYFPKATCESTFAFETNTAPGQFVPVHIHPTQDEFILVQEGMLDLKLDIRDLSGGKEQMERQLEQRRDRQQQPRGDERGARIR